MQNETLLKNLTDFIELLESASNALESSSSPSAEAEKTKTQHIQYMQYVVDQMTAVFIHFRKAEAVKRSYDSEGVFGDFPEFIRAASLPTLTAFYRGFSEKPKHKKNLNVQIQAAVRKAKPAHE